MAAMATAATARFQPSASLCWQREEMMSEDFEKKTKKTNKLQQIKSFFLHIGVKTFEHPAVVRVCACVRVPQTHSHKMKT